MTVKTIIDHGGVDYSAVVMTIRRTTLGMQDHGIWTATLHCEGDSVGVGVGGYTLDNRPADSPLDDNKRHGSAFGMDHIMTLCQIVGVDTWEQLHGKKIYVLFEMEGDGGAISNWGCGVAGIANIDTGTTLILQDHAQKWHDLKRIEA